MGSVNGITFGGLASGLDSKAIIQALVAIERRPIQKLNDQKTLIGKQKGLFGDLETKLLAVKTAASDLKATSEFLEFKTGIDEEGFFKATAGSSANKGSYTIHVERLAKTKVATSLGKPDKDSTTYDTGKIDITVDGATKTVTIDTSNNTLQGIANAINNADAGVTATVVDTGEATNPFKLVVSSQQSGTRYAFALTETTGSGALNTLINEVSGNIVVGAADADLTVNGVRVTRSSNVITDVVSGVTLELTGVHTLANVDSVLTVTPDSTAVKEKVTKFVEAYNEVVNFIKKQFTVDSQGKASSPVFGDSTLRSIRSELRTILGTSVDTGNPSYNLLSQVGLTADRDGLLTLSEDKFKTAIETDDEAVENLFAMAGAGIARKVFDKTEGWLNIVDGPLQLRKKGFDTRTKTIDDQIRSMEARVKAFETRLTMRFANAELAIGRLKAQGNSLGIQF